MVFIAMTERIRPTPSSKPLFIALSSTVMIFFTPSDGIFMTPLGKNMIQSVLHSRNHNNNPRPFAYKHKII